MSDQDKRGQAVTDDSKLSAAANVFVPRWKRMNQEAQQMPNSDGDDSSFVPTLGPRSVSMPKPNWLETGNSGSARGSPWKASPTRANSNFSRSASWRDDAARRESGGTAVEGKASVEPTKAITVEHKLVRPGTYSTWIRVLSADIGPAQLATVLSRCEDSNGFGTIHVYLREKFLNRQLVQQLRSQGYKFHHYVEDTQTFVYGKRPQDAEDGRELMNATCKELIGALVVSPDEQQVLLTWEGGKWSFVSGYIITRENVIDSLRREVRSQLNLELDRSFAPRMVGGWNKAAEKFDCINEFFVCFMVRAASIPPTMEDHVRWFSIDELMQLVDMVDSQTGEQGVEAKLESAIEHPPGNVFSHLTLRWVKSFRNNKSWDSANVAGRHVFFSM